jgi:hypothetical protein
MVVILKSPHIRMAPFDVTAITMGDAHSMEVTVGSTGSRMSSVVRRSSSSSTARRNGNGTSRGENALGFAAQSMWTTASQIVPRPAMKMLLHSSSNCCSFALCAGVIVFGADGDVGGIADERLLSWIPFGIAMLRANSQPRPSSGVSFCSTTCTVTVFLLLNASTTVSAFLSVVISTRVYACKLAVGVSCGEPIRCSTFFPNTE